ncbi:MAG: SulP family inorganic anion transporter, partial [Burkholderiaceae bacterium]|nr:SulP family inorganic anion transporter [Burkholderiaceae bacterium]
MLKSKLMNTSTRAGLPVADMVAGLAIAGLLLPEAVAYASIANVPPQMAVIALFAGLICYALLGTSRFAIVSATSSSAAVLAAAATGLAGGDPAARLGVCAALVIAAGAYFVAASAARLGAITDFIAKPVLRGFTFGLALVIVIKQLPTLAGIHASSSNIFGLLFDILRQAPHWNIPSLCLGLGSLVLLLLCGRMKSLPGALIAIVLATLLCQWLALPAHGVAQVGHIEIALSMPHLPQLASSQWLQSGELALALALIIYAESYGSIRGFAIKHGDPVAPNRDLAALGIANLVSGLLQGMPVGAGYSASAANEAAGANSRLAGLFGAAVLLLVVLLLLPLIAYTPEAVLAAIVIHAVSHTLNPAPLLACFRMHRDRLVVVVAVLAVLLLGVVDGLLLAIALSIVMTLHRFSESRLSELGRLAQGHDFVSTQLHPDAKPEPGVLIVRPEEPLFFANVERILSEVGTLASARPEAHIIILSLEESPDLDSSSVESLRGFLHV